MKKRVRKDLTIEEMEQIVAAASLPFTTHKDIAFTFRVSKILVSRLVTEADREPQKLQELRRKREIKEQEKVAVQ